MGENTKIQWAHHTFNPWRGCTKVAAGCANCYAEAQSKRNHGTLGVWGSSGTRVVASESMWQQPTKWNADAACRRDDANGTCDVCMNGPPRVFCASLADVFEDWYGVVRNARGFPLHAVNKSRDEWEGIVSTYIGRSVIRLGDVRVRLFRMIDATPNLNWLLLTKRPENVRRMTAFWMSDRVGAGRESPDSAKLAPNNVWLGTSISCQADADRNIPELLKCRDLCAKTFLSIEPLVEPVRLNSWIDGNGQFHHSQGVDVDWVIVGGESGPNARPCALEWIWDIVDQCQAVGVPCFVKQLGAFPVVENANVWDFDHEQYSPLGDSAASARVRLHDKKGGDPAEWPEWLRVREVPS